MQAPTNRINTAIKALLLPMILFVGWHLCCQHLSLSNYLLPTPSMVFGALFDMIISGELFSHVVASLTRVMIGFVLTSSVALSFACIFIRFPQCYAYFHVTFEAIRVIPPLAFSPLLIVWMGIGEGPKITIIFLAAFFPIFLNAYSGLRNIDTRYLELAKSLDLSRFETIKHIHFPFAVPSIVTGLRLGFGYSWRALMGAELIAAASGLGFLIVDAEELARTDKAMAGIIVIAILGLILDTLIKRLTKNAHYCSA